VRPYAQKRRRVGTSTVPAKRLRAERRNHVWALDFIFEAKVLYFDWCDVYNNFRPHSSLGYLAPAMFAALLLGKLPTPELQTR